MLDFPHLKGADLALSLGEGAIFRFVAADGWRWALSPYELGAWLEDSDSCADGWEVLDVVDHVTEPREGPHASLARLLVAHDMWSPERMALAACYSVLLRGRITDDTAFRVLYRLLGPLAIESEPDKESEEECNGSNYPF